MNLFIDKSKTCCFTGPRPQNTNFEFNDNDLKYLQIKKELSYTIEKAISNGYCYFLCGMAIGFDTLCAELLIEKKYQHNHIKIFGIIPCKSQCKFWSETQQNKYIDLLKKLDGSYCLYDNYIGAKCMIERNYVMVDNSSLLIALNSYSKGTQSTIQYAKNKNLKINLIKM